MSIDVFGRALKGKEVTRGSPGIGYKLTETGQFDAEGKRLSNLATPQDLKDAVNLQALNSLIDIEVQSLYALIKRLRSDVDDLSTILNSYKSEINNQVQEKIDRLDWSVDRHERVIHEIQDSGWVRSE